MPNLSPDLAALAAPPAHFDTRIPAWIKIFIILFLTAGALLIDRPISAWAIEHPGAFWDIASASPAAKKGDVARDMMWLEQFGHVACTAVAVILVALLDPAGRRKALAIAIACTATLIVTHLLKDTFGRSRPNVAIHETDLKLMPGESIWGGPAKGFTKGADWGSFPSAHTTAAFALASALSWFYPRARALFMALAVITATQRIFHQAHFLSDTLFGLGVGVFVTRAALRLNPAGKLIAAAPPNIQKWWLNH